MQPDNTLPRRIARVLIPTVGQTVGALILAAIIVGAAHIKQIVQLIHIDSVTLNVAIDQFHDRTAGILSSHAAEATALVSFWSLIGMVAYLICWSVYNLMIEARNEVTLTTQYTNRGHAVGHLQAVGLKALAAVLLVAALILLKPGLAYWLLLSNGVFSDFGSVGVALAVAAVAGLALQLYLLLAMVIATFTPWYRK